MGTLILSRAFFCRIVFYYQWTLGRLESVPVRAKNCVLLTSFESLFDYLDIEVFKYELAVSTVGV